MKCQADKRRVDRQFTVGDAVYLKLQPYHLWLSFKFFGPFTIQEHIGKVAYKLLPP
jgi:hypothetical protein